MAQCSKFMHCLHVQHVVRQEPRQRQGAAADRRPLGGTLETGRVADYTDAGNDNRKLCSLYLSLMDRMDVKLDRFGDADTRWPGSDTCGWRLFMAGYASASTASA